MHRNTKRLASALLAAALCLLLVPQAGADYEPWTYEVDDVMSTYGVEYYADVGFENPTRTADQTAAQSAADSTVSTYAADAVPFALESGVAVYAEDGANVVADSYEVTIPAGVTVNTESDTAELKVQGTVQPYQKLKIAVSSEDYTLKCTDNNTYTIVYGIALENGTNITADTAAKTYAVDTDAAQKEFSTTMNIKVENKDKAQVSGDYTDTLTFSMECTPKTYAVVYHANGGTGTMEKSVAQCTNAVTLTANSFSDADHQFAGWTTSDTTATKISEVDYSDKGSIATASALWKAAADGAGYDYQIDLYAQWGYRVILEAAYEALPGGAVDSPDNEIVYDKVLLDDDTMHWSSVEDTAYQNKIVQRDNPYLPTNAYSQAYNARWVDTSCTLTMGELKSGKTSAGDTISSLTQDMSQGIYKIETTVQRQKYMIDMNGTGPAAVGGNLGKMGTAVVYVNGTPQTSTLDNDFWREFPWGSKFTAVVTPAEGYRVSKMVYNAFEGSNLDYGVLTGTEMIGTDATTTKKPNASSVNVHFMATSTEQVTAAETDTTTAADTVDADDASAAPETTPAADTTPDDLRIMDADEMLAEFALQDAQPVW